MKGVIEMQRTHHLSSLLKSTASAFLLVVGLSVATSASAQTVIGQLDFAGTWEPIDSDNNATNPLNATGLRFLESEYPILLALGAFSDLEGQNVTIETQQFQFTGPFPLTIWSAAGGATYFEAHDMVVEHQDASAINLRAEGAVFRDGTQHDGRFLFSGQGALGFTFSSSTLAGEDELPPPTAVPEPAAIAVLGLGLLGFAFMRRRLV
jgi:hypothetical protein